MALPYKVATLLYCFNDLDEVLLLERAQEPNRGRWSPPGGKLRTRDGESPFACAAREAREELGLLLRPEDLHLTGLVSEHGYQGAAHWLMFLFEVRPRLKAAPPAMKEGRFQFFPRAALAGLPLPDTDIERIWPWFWQHRGGFFAAHCLCEAGGRNVWTLEESSVGSAAGAPEGAERGRLRPQPPPMPADAAADGGVHAPTPVEPPPGNAPRGGEAGGDGCRPVPDWLPRPEAPGRAGPPIIDLESDDHFMREALRLAARAWAADEVPVGAVVVRAGRAIARAWNQVELLKDATAHAEMLALTQAQAAVGDWRLNDCTLYVTKEPCPMCAGAMVHARVARVVFGASDAKAGAAGSALNLLQFPTLNHRCVITAGVRDPECRDLLRQFFAAQRARNKAAEGGRSQG